MKKAIIAIMLLLTGCIGMPDTVRPVENFELERYLGKWYEIARLDHPFERGLTHVTAEYSMRQDGGIRIINRGYSHEKGEWKQAEGRAYFVDNPHTGFLKVSFFGPFYGSYVIFQLDHENYSYALVSGPNTSYLWLLARAPEINHMTRNKLMEAAAERGFDTSAIIHVPHEKQHREETLTSR